LKQEKSFYWIHKIEPNQQYNFFGGLMNYLLDCLLEDNKLNDKVSFFEFGKNNLKNKFPKSMIWMVNAVEETEVMKTEVGKFAEALNGGSALLKTDSSKNIKVSYETIADLLNNFYSNSAINLKQTDKQRRTRPRFHHAKKI
jgi:hypothetical protein